MMTSASQSLTNRNDTFVDSDLELGEVSSCIPDAAYSNTRKSFSYGCKRRASLKRASVTCQNKLSADARHLYQRVLECKRKLSRLRYGLKSFKQRAAAAEKLARSPNFASIMDRVNPLTYQFIISQVRTQKQKPKGRRFTLEEKLLALTILKASGKGYRLLSKIFALPCRRTLSNLLNKIPLSPGINKHLFTSLEQSVEKMSKLDKTAILIFDEMAIDNNVFYNQKEDVIIGLQDYGSGDKQGLLADYANVFMVKGVYRQWKQPVCFTFSSGPSKSFKTKQTVLSVIRECHKIGLRVVATVCDQGSANQAAINLLLKETKEEYLQRSENFRGQGFEVDGWEVVPLYDTPHLFKRIRNNLLTKDLHFKISGQEHVAKWEHIEQFYFLDLQDEDRMCPKLTDQHVLPSKINKMKVSFCTQVFSHQVGTLMKRIISWKSEVKLDPEAIGTSAAILFFDKLFDSLNSSRRTGPPGKPYKAGVTKGSPHRDFWRECLNILKTMKFFSKKKNTYVSVPSLQNLIITVERCIYISSKLIEKNGGFLLLRVFQQDCLENFFSIIRSYGARENSPTAGHFISSFKALLTNNFMSAHSPGANCEADQHRGPLDNLRSFLTNDALSENNPSAETEIPVIPTEISLHKRSKIGRCTATYISGFIAMKMLKKNSCSVCRRNILYRENDIDTDFIQARQYPLSKLIKPGSYFHFLSSRSLSTLFYLIPRLCHLKHISVVLQRFLLKQFNFSLINCPQHKNNDQAFAKVLVRCSLYFWCKKINLISKGRDEKFVKFLNISNRSLIDPVKLAAHNKYLSRKKYKHK